MVQDKPLSRAQRVCGKEQLPIVESAISMRTLASTASTEAILGQATGEAGRAGHTVLTIADGTNGKQDEKLEVPNDADLAALRHRYAFFSLKFVLGVREACSPVQVPVYTEVLYM